MLNSTMSSRLLPTSTDFGLHRLLKACILTYTHTHTHTYTHTHTTDVLTTDDDDDNDDNDNRRTDYFRFLLSTGQN